MSNVPPIVSEPLWLFPNAGDRDHGSIGSRRTVLGAVGEDVASALLGLERRRASSGCAVCADFMDTQNKIAWESKAMKHSGGRLLWYEHATTGYQSLVKDNWVVRILLWRWRADLEGCKYTSDFHETLLRPGVWSMACISFGELISACIPEHKQLLNSGVRSSANRSGYGWCLTPQPWFDVPVATEVQLTVRGRTFKVPVHSNDLFFMDSLSKRRL